MNWPHQGALRLHHDPTRLPIQRPADQPGRDRFDDPIGEFVMRYVASDLRGCLIETMDRFRPNPKAEALLASISGSEEVPGKTPALVDGVDEWLAQQRVAHVQLETAEALLVDVNDPEVLERLDSHPRVRAVLDASDLGTEVSPARLDGGLIRLSGRYGRPITQAVARAVHEWFPDCVGVGYRSRHDDRTQCWAVYGTTPVTFGATIEVLDPTNEGHARAVRDVAKLFRIPLPARWHA